MIADPDNDRFFSLACVWEMQIKTDLGKLSLRKPLRDIVLEQSQNRMAILAIRLDHILKLGQLPLHHSDRFDRLLIAQALNENFAVVSKDEAFRAYGVTVIYD